MKHNKNKHILTFITLMIVAVAIGVALFFLINPANDSNFESEPISKPIDVTKDNTSKITPDAELTGDPAFVDGKTPTQYEGQTTGNANCVDSECSNFNLSEDSLLPEDR